MKQGDFTKYVETIKNKVTAGELTEQEAVYLVLGKTAQIFRELSISHEQFMKDRAFEALNIN